MSKKSHENKDGWFHVKQKKQTQLETKHDTSSIHLKYNNSSSPSHHLKKIDHCRDFATNPGSRGMMITQGRFLEKQQTNALIFKMINPIAQIKSKIEYSKQSNILFTHYEKFRIKQSSSSIIQTWANNEICE